MGKMIGRFGDHGSQSVNRNRRSSPFTQRPPKHPSRQLVWVPAIPSWEKEFCYRIGRFKWENFLEAKKLTEFTPKVFEWNDSAAEEAFRSAKNRFFAHIHGLPNSHQSDPIPSPDLYIDVINWDNDEEEGIDLDGLEELSTISGKEKENAGGGCGPDYYQIPIEDIRPTGWDVDVEEICRGRVLTGLIVG